MNLGLVIYAGNIDSLSLFYINALKFEKMDFDESYIRLVNSHSELVILKATENYATDSTSPREHSAIKPVFFTNETLINLRESISTFGGYLKPANNEWCFNNFMVCDGHDTEGNIFQIRTEI